MTLLLAQIELARKPAGGYGSPLEYMVRRLHWPRPRAARMVAIMHKVNKRIGLPDNDQSLRDYFAWYFVRNTGGNARRWADAFHSYVGTGTMKMIESTDAHKVGMMDYMMAYIAFGKALPPQGGFSLSLLSKPAMQALQDAHDGKPTKALISTEHKEKAMAFVLAHIETAAARMTDKSFWNSLNPRQRTHYQSLHPRSPVLKHKVDDSKHKLTPAGREKAPKEPKVTMPKPVKPGARATKGGPSLETPKPAMRAKSHADMKEAGKYLKQGTKWMRDNPSKAMMAHLKYTGPTVTPEESRLLMEGMGYKHEGAFKRPKNNMYTSYNRYHRYTGNGQVVEVHHNGKAMTGLKAESPFN